MATRFVNCFICGRPPQYSERTVCFGHGEYVVESSVRCLDCGVSCFVETRDPLEVRRGLTIARWNVLQALIRGGSVVD